MLDINAVGAEDENLIIRVDKALGVSDEFAFDAIYKQLCVTTRGRLNSVNLGMSLLFEDRTFETQISISVDLPSDRDQLPNLLMAISEAVGNATGVLDATVSMDDMCLQRFGQIRETPVEKIFC